MDHFLIRNPQPSPSKSPTKSGKPRMKQATIESLKGVVVIEDILHHKSRLLLPTSSKEEKLDSLRELGKKVPPRHVLTDTKIGKVIKKLTKDEDSDIKKAANLVYTKWKSHFIQFVNNEMIEVKYDLKSEKLRKSGRSLLAGALDVEESDLLPGTIEKETFHSHKRLLSGGYRRTIRHLVFSLKSSEDLKNKVKSGEITVTDFVKEYKKS
ncbi:Transcription elongation factor A N-terminal and central domain-containing protein 2 [Mactra antiquata]